MTTVELGTKIRYVSDGTVLLQLSGLRWVVRRSSSDWRALDWNYKGAEGSHNYGKDEDAEKRRDEMFNLVISALEEASCLGRTTTYMAFKK